jgi:predicted ArsR family transcriptional regulator
MTDKDGLLADDLNTRDITDPRELRALTHPVRLALLEVLAVQGALTATQAGELIGESPTTCSFHFRQLAKYGFVEEAGGGTGRNRPWRRVHLGMNIPGTSQDGETAVAADSLTGLFYSRMFARFEHWHRVKHTYVEEWQEAASVGEWATYMTSDELRALAGEIRSLMQPYVKRLVEANLRPEGARLVEVLAASYPVEFARGVVDTASDRAEQSGGA